jgi:hypothetical protein
LRAVGAIYGAGPWSDDVTDTPTSPAPESAPNNDNSGGGFGFYVSVTVETKTITIDTSTTTDTSTNTTHNESASTVTSETKTLSPTIRKIRIQLKVPFRPNSYFLNDAAKREIAAVVKKYNRLKVEKYIVLAYSTPSVVNPYPTLLGTWRSKAVYKQMLSYGMKGKGSALYGGLYKGKRALAYRPVIVLYIRP